MTNMVMGELTLRNKHKFKITKNENDKICEQTHNTQIISMK